MTRYTERTSDGTGHGVRMTSGFVPKKWLTTEPKMSGDTVGDDQVFDDEDDDALTSCEHQRTGPNRQRVETSGTSLWIQWFESVLFDL